MIKIDFIHNNAGRDYQGEMSQYVKISKEGVIYSDVGKVSMLSDKKDEMNNKTTTPL